MKLSVIGTGYLGAVHAACMAELGHDVIGVDVDEQKIARLSQGIAPFHEPGFDELLRRNVDEGRLTFTSDFAQAANAQVHFIGVGTPQQEGSHAADMRYVNAAVDAILPYLTDAPNGRGVVVGKSTVPVGTADSLEPRILEAGGVLIWNPEFLREGFAVEDTLDPDRLVYGLTSDSDNATYSRNLLDEVYAPIIERGTPRLIMDFPTSELVKVSANSFLATKISFINAMSEICDATGADVTMLAEAIGLDDRIGKKFLRAGIGFGGGCLPKDIRAFLARATELGMEDSLAFLYEVDAINNRRRHHAVELAQEAVGGDFSGKNVAILGAAFKPNTDDMRNSPAMDIAEAIRTQGATVTVTDPAAGPVLKQGNPEVVVMDSAEEAMEDADVVLLLTEWDEFKNLDPLALKEIPRQPYIIDGRNALDVQRWKDAGWTYRGMGRR